MPDDGLIHDRIDRSGVTGGSEEVSIRGGLGRGHNALLRTEAGDVPFHGVCNTASWVSLNRLAEVRSRGLIVGQGAEAGLQDSDKLRIDLRSIVDDMAVVDVHTYEALACVEEQEINI